jgi:pimeloyl-ACP methyl ester carboxylesterase
MGCGDAHSAERRGRSGPASLSQHSDVLPTPIAQEMTQRGPRAQLVEFPKIGHAPALMDPTRIAIIAEFLRP